MEQAQFQTLSPEEIGRQLQAIMKSLDGGGYNNFSGGVDALQTGAGALRPENLDHVIKDLTFKDNMATFWKDAPKRDSKTIVTEAVTQDLGTTAGFYEDGGLPQTGTDHFARLVRNIKFIGVQGKVTGVANQQTLIAPAKATETNLKTKAIIRSLDVEGLYGDSGVNERSFDGIIKQFTDNLPAGYVGQNIIDKAGAALEIEDFSDATRIIADNYGNPNNVKLWTGFGAVNEMNQALGTSKQFYVNGNGPIGGTPIGYKLGENSGGIVTPFGAPVEIKTDVFMGKRRPMNLNQAQDATVAVGASTTAATATAVAADESNSVLPVGSVYRYFITTVYLDGESAAHIPADVTLHASTKQKVTITITRTGGATEKGYRVWRLKSPSSNPLSAAVHIGNVAVAGATTTLVDLGAVYDGTTDVFMIDWSEEVFRWDVLLYMQKFDIASLGDYVAWIQRNWSTPFLMQPRKMVLFKNVKSYTLK
ncbi:MAG: hypothetical protein HUU10_04435 [Bacteroidetes bacterium]|nr:hypothetical protein [Bacteroidota bacterium]